MPNKKLAQRSLSALVFALGASQAAHANEEINIQNLEMSEESQLSEEEFRALANARTASTRGNWGGSGSFISSGNYSSFISSGNYANFISSGNYADFISAGNYANFISSGNYGRVNPEADPNFPSPQVAQADIEVTE